MKKVINQKDKKIGIFLDSFDWERIKNSVDPSSEFYQKMEILLHEDEIMRQKAQQIMADIESGKEKTYSWEEIREILEKNEI